MKELSTNEKAKRYDKAIKVAADIKAGTATYITDGTPVVDAIFPELKESEDERIRKELIFYLRYQHSISENFEDIGKWIAWLEKQGSQNNTEDEDLLYRFCFYSYKDESNILYLSGLYVNGECRNKGIGTKILEVADEVAKNLNCYAIRLKTKIGSNAERLYRRNGYNTLIKEGNQIWLEKQGEQKPADNVEPKFHEGEWITNGDYTWKIVEIKPFDYILQSQDGNIVDDTIYHVDEQFNSFTIQDAKDGDVLVTKNKNIFIFKSISDCTIYDYCGLYFGKFMESSATVNGHAAVQLSTDYTPATKEQRDTLFAKMKEAGYEWDIEKKELKKIEDEEYNGEDYGIDGLWHAMNILEKTLGKVNGYQTDDGFLSHQCAITAVKKLYKQKPAWSEEDEKMFKSLNKLLNEASCYSCTEGVDKILAWLKQKIG